MQYLWTLKGGSQVLPWLPAKSITFEWGSWSKNERTLFKWAEFWRQKGEPNCSRRWQTTFLFIRSASLIKSLVEVQQYLFSYKICLAVQLEAKQSWYAQIERKKTNLVQEPFVERLELGEIVMDQLFLHSFDFWEVSGGNLEQKKTGSEQVVLVAQGCKWSRSHQLYRTSMPGSACRWSKQQF